MTIAPFAQPQLFQKTISDTTQLQDSISKLINKVVSDPTVFSDNLVVTSKNLSKNLIDALIAGDSQQKIIGKVAQDSGILQDNIQKAFTKIVQDNPSLNDILTRFAVKGQTLQDVTVLADHLTVTLGRTLADNTVLADFLTRSVTFTGVIMDNEPEIDLIDTDDLSIDIESTIV